LADGRSPCCGSLLPRPLAPPPHSPSPSHARGRRRRWQSERAPFRRCGAGADESPASLLQPPHVTNTSGSVRPSGCLRAFACTSTPAYVCMWRYTRIYSPPRRAPPAFTRRYLSVSLISGEIARRRLLASQHLRAFTRGLPPARRPLPVFAWWYMPASCVCLRVWQNAHRRSLPCSALQENA
ncbi:hypothetical protein B0H11DRAFT_2101618, partial [Mycena galericulata]